MVVVLFDTNIYGKMFEDPVGEELAERIRRDNTFTIHNFRLIRNELRRIPKILPLYDSLVAHRMLDETRQIKGLAKAYFNEYKANGGKQGRKRIIADFKIVACASILGCDIIYSEDERTLKHAAARAAYEIVDSKKNLRPPYLLSYSTLKRRYF